MISTLRRPVSGLALAFALVVALPVGLAIVGGSTWLLPAHTSTAIPSTVYRPLPFTATAQDAPPGPATLLISGEGSLSGSFDDDGHNLVLGQGGTYRLIRTANDVNAGQDLLISPDGRFVAGPGTVEGTNTDSAFATTVLDLTTGEQRLVSDEAIPVAWAPDNRRLLIATPVAGEADTWRLALRDIDSGATVDLFPVAERPAGHRVAFSPDGTRLAWQGAHGLTVHDLDGLTQHQIVAAGDDRTLAGPGAFMPDGRLAVWDASRRLTLVDAATGTTLASPGFDPVDGATAWVLGWQADGSAVVEVFVRAESATATRDPLDVARPEGIFAYHPAGGRTRVVTVPPDAHRIDVARERLDAMGGQPQSWLTRASDVVNTRVVEIVLIGLVGAGAVGAVGWWRRRGRALVDRWASPR